MTRVPSSTLREFAKFCAAALIASTVTATVLTAVFGWGHVWWSAAPVGVILCGLEARRLLRSKSGSGSSTENPKNPGE